MTDEGDKAILEMADEIRRKESQNQKEIRENEEKNWYNSMVGKYFIDTVYRGAHDEAFKVFWVRGLDWGALKVDEVYFAHIGHFGIGYTSIRYDKKWEFDDGYWKEIDEIEFLQYLQKFLSLTGWKQKLDKESDH